MNSDSILIKTKTNCKYLMLALEFYGMKSKVEIQMLY